MASSHGCKYPDVKPISLIRGLFTIRPLHDIKGKFSFYSSFRVSIPVQVPVQIPKGAEANNDDLLTSVKCVR